MKNQLPAHLEALFEKRAQKFKDFGCNEEPAIAIARAINKAKEVGDDDSLTHAIIA